MTGQHPFLPPDVAVDTAVLIVTYNSADDLPRLLADLELVGRQLPIRVVVADNGSTDNTLEVLAAHPDLVIVTGHGNVGYAAAINLMAPFVDGARHVLILNPDLYLDIDCVTNLVAAIDIHRAGVVVPRIIDGDGHTYFSLRREPSVTRAIADALVGRRWANRPGWLSEIDHRPASYRTAHRVDWATGAALLVRADVFAQVGPWEEQFFLYSEETDFFRRARDAGHQVWFDPTCTTHHRGGGSGSSPGLSTLMAVNRVRYARLHMTAGRARRFRAAVALAELVRAYQPGHRRTLAWILDEKRWSGLPQAQAAPAQYMPGDPEPQRGAVVVPAHDEAAVIGRTLAPLAPLAAAGVVEIVVACNGCTDDTAAVARAFPGVTVIETAQPSKVAALNAADSVATWWPRLYLDADIRLEPAAVLETLDRLAVGDLQAARPAAVYETAAASWPVRSYYRARSRVPALHESLWGGGCYGLSWTGHQRFGLFPDVVADDLFVDHQFDRHEKAVLEVEHPAVIAVPRTAGSLLSVLRRVQRGKALEPPAGNASGTASNGGTAAVLCGLLRSTRTPRSVLDTLVYSAFSVLARRSAPHRTERWERDTTTR